MLLFALLLLELSEFFLELLFVLHLGHIVPPFLVVESFLFWNGLSWHALLVKSHIHRVMHQTWLAENWRSSPTITFDAAYFDEHTGINTGYAIGDNKNL